MDQEGKKKRQSIGCTPQSKKRNADGVLGAIQGVCRRERAPNKTPRDSIVRKQVAPTKEKNERTTHFCCWFRFRFYFFFFFDRKKCPYFIDDMGRG